MQVDGSTARIRLDRQAVLDLIDKNGGAEGLDLSGFDLSRANLSRLNLCGIIFGTNEILKTAESEDVLTQGAILDGAWLERADLQRANFGRTSLRETHFYQANLSEASLWVANAEGADFRKANLSKANLYATILKDCRLMDSVLEGANLSSADLSGATLSAESIGQEILQENLAEYRRYYARWYTSPQVKHLYEKYRLERRYKAATEIYLSLKNAFMGAGRYEDASWAYIKEREMERHTYNPVVARLYYSKELPKKRSAISLRWWKFYIRYSFKWLMSWLSDLLVGYGEKPLRATLCSLVAIVFFTLLFWLSGGISSTTGEPVRLLDYFQYSLATFSTVGFADLVPTNEFAKFATSIEALTGISLLALVMFSLGNRINRS